jgi:release factor glutamine methyltransferase
VVINELLKIGVDELKDIEFAHPQLEARLILSKLLNKDKSYIYAYGDKEISNEIKDKYFEILKLRSQGHPFQYIVKEKEFMGLDFYVEEGVLIPRPDTEILVEYVIEYVKQRYNNKSIRGLELGIGSGAISLSVANYCSNAYIYGVDIEDAPIKVSNINKEKFNLSNVSFLKGDMFEALKGLNLENSFDVIMSNPPYIPSKEIEKLQIEVKTYEPRIALDGGEDGLKFYRIISSEAGNYLVEGGLLIYEIGYNQGLAVKEILLSNGYKDIQILKDLQGHDRVVLGLYH